MSRTKFVTQISLVLFMSCFIGTEVQALVAFDQNYNFNFRFNNPGARANGMGGAFIGLADDASAAYTNPAGLTILNRPEISIEYKRTDYENIQYANTGTGFEYDEEGDGLSFISLVFPTKKATFAVYRHQLIKITNDYALPQLFYTADTDIKAVTYGFGAGLDLVPHKLTLGLAAGFSRLDYYFTSDLFVDQSLTYPPFTRYLVDEEDAAEHYTVSLLWNPIGELNIGLVYRQGPEFVTTMERLSDADTDGLFESSQLAKNTLKVPDAYGLGISYQFAFGLTVAADVNRILYSDLVEDLVFANGQTQFAGLRASDFTADDQTEFHIGIEYVIDLDTALMALRGGYYRKPEHRIRYEGTNPDIRNIARKGEDDDIYSLGAGVTWSNVQIDAAGSLGEFEHEITVSIVYRFD